jgi:hypothetical protein
MANVIVTGATGIAQKCRHNNVTDVMVGQVARTGEMVNT